VPRPVWDLAVVGVGNMGVSVLGAFLDKGRRCLAIDVDAAKVAELGRGRSVVPERGAEAIFARAVADGRLEATTDLRRAADAICVFVGVQTPAKGNRCDYSALQHALRDLAGAAAPGQTIVVGSTVFPGGIRESLLPALLTRPDLVLVYEPVFLRAGFGIEDYLRPGKFVFGLDHPDRVPSALRCLFESVVDAEPAYVTWEEAEWIKMVHNAWMALKITFVNEIDQLCRAFQTDSDRVLQIAFEENVRGRLMTRSHMIPGPPYSGPCLPKDAAVLGGLVSEHGPNWMRGAAVCEALHTSNERYVETLVDEWIARGRRSGRSLGIVGISFRPDFNEMRGSLALPFIRQARRQGLAVVGYDPAFEGIGRDEYRCVCRDDSELEDLYEIVRHSLETVWQEAAVVLVNRRLTSAERGRLTDRPRPALLDLYQNAL
jgi:nucleotide sugar dehydrogenase